MKLKIALTASLITWIATPALADDGAVLYNSASIAKYVPSQLKQSQSDHYRALFAAMSSNQWDTAKNLIDTAPDGPLKSIAKAEYFLAANSPRAELGPLLVLVNEAPQIPQAAQLGRLAQKRGAQLLPDLPQRRNLPWVPGSPIRSKPKDVDSDRAANGIRGQIIHFIKTDNPQGAEELLNMNAMEMSAEGRTELEQRIAWSYYIENDDTSALRLARRAQNGAGEWVGHADWVAGLAAWRLNDCQSASSAFERVGRSAANVDLKAAGLYWSARADLRCGQPTKVQGKLQAAARHDDSFYGMLAVQTLGMTTTTTKADDTFEKSDWRALRHQATIGPDSDHPALIKLARELNLPRTQLWLAHNAPRGMRPDALAGFPAPKWKPDGGWRVDPALIYAHTLQESAFRSQVVSPANAIGLMQVRPGTAGDIARANGRSFSEADLYRPSTNLEYGQSYLEYLGNSSITEGKLPKIAAAYNAGPGSVQRWNSEIKDNDDPLLFMESIPYVETRGYVSIIMRNYWMYEKQAGIPSVSARALSQNHWPRFPGHPDKRKIQFTSR